MTSKPPKPINDKKPPRTARKQKCSNQNLGLIVYAGVEDLVSNIVSFGIERGVLRKATAKVFSHFNTGKLSNQCQEPDKWEFFSSAPL